MGDGDRGLDPPERQEFLNITIDDCFHQENLLASTSTYKSDTKTAMLSSILLKLQLKWFSAYSIFFILSIHLSCF